MACAINQNTIKNGIVNDVVSTLVATGRYIKSGGSVVKTIDPYENLKESIDGLDSKVQKDLKFSVTLPDSKVNNVLPDSEASRVSKWLSKTYPKSKTAKAVAENVNAEYLPDSKEGIKLRNEGLSVSNIVESLNNEGIDMSVNEFGRRALPKFLFDNVTTDTIVNNRNEAIDKILDEQFNDDYLLDSINSEFGDNVVSKEGNVVTISPSNELVNSYLETYRGDREANEIVERVMGVTVPSVSTQQKNKVDLLLERMGVKVDNINNITIKGQRISENGVALPLQALVGYAEGQENVLPEEAFHIAIEILEEKHPGLLNQMLSHITNLPIYQEVYEKYSSNPLYQKDGKPDIRKIKKEAIAQQLAILAGQETKVKNWWQKVIAHLKEWFSNANVDIRPFKDTLDKLYNTDIGTVRNTILKSRRYLRNQGISEENIDQIIELANSPINDDELRLFLEQIVPTQAYYSISDKTKNTYTKLTSATFPAGSYESFFATVKKAVGNIFGESKLDIADELIAQFQDKDKGALRQDIDNILSRYINPDGTRRTSPLAFTDAKTGRNSYDIVEEKIVEKLDQFEGGKFIVNKEIASSKTGLKGKVDLIAIDSQGRASIIQFMPVSQERVDNNYVRVAQEYLKSIQSTLTSGYNVQTTQVRAIPLPIEDGVVEDSIDDDLYPELAGTMDKTGIAQIDLLIGRLSATLSRANRGVADDRIASQLMKAIRQIQVKGASDRLSLAINSVEKRIRQITDEYELAFQEDVDGNEITLEDKTSEEISEMADQMHHALMIASNLKNLYNAINAAHKENPSVYEKPKGTLRRSEDRLDGAVRALMSKNEDLMDRFVSKSAGVEGVLIPERPVSAINKMFKTIYEPMTKATSVLSKLWQRINRKAEDETLREVNTRMKKIRGAYDKMFKASGRSLRDGYLSFIAKKDSQGRYVHELIDKHDKAKFEDGLRKALKNNDVKWLEENVDMKAYQEWYRETREKVVKEYEGMQYHSDKEENDKIIKAKIERWEDRYRVDSDVNKLNNKLKYFITDKFLSKEYINLTKNKPALDLYNYIREINETAYKQGLMGKEQAERMIPFVEKKLLEKLTQGGKMSASPDLLRGLVSPEEYDELTRVDPETGRSVQSIPFRYITDISTERKDGSKDYSNVSQDIFSILPLYLQQTKIAVEIRKNESQLLLLGLLEKNKPVLATNRFNEVIPEQGVVSNDRNFDYYQNFLSGALYGNKYVDNSDTRIASFSGRAAKWMNKTFGTNLDERETTTSVNQFIHTANKLFSLKILGGNVFIPLANFVGSNANALINTNSREFSTGELVQSELEAVTDRFKSEEERSKYHGLAEYFQMLYNGASVDRASRKMSLSVLTKRSIPEFLMSLQEYSEIPLQIGIGMAMLNNYMVSDGKIVKIYDYVAEKYPNYLDVSQAERKNIDAKIKEEVDKLKETSSLRKVAKLKGDELIIPGLERSSEAVFDFIGKIHAVVRKATGGGTKESFRQANQNIWLASLMVFKSWLPRLLENRVGRLTYNQSLGEFEMGRYRAIGDVVGTKFFQSLSRLYNVATLNDKGVEILKEQYEEHLIKYKERTGEDLNMTQREYVLMYRDLIRASIKDSMFFAGLAGLFFGVAALGSGDDDEEVSGGYKFLMNLTNRFYKEMSIFYNPMEMHRFLDNGTLPVLGVTKDVMNVFKEGGKTFGYIITGDDELKSETHLFKAVTKPFPISSMLNMYLPVFAEEYAKELGYRPPRLN